MPDPDHVRVRRLLALPETRQLRKAPNSNGTYLIDWNEQTTELANRLGQGIQKGMF
jgi:hypothetical protein